MTIRMTDDGPVQACPRCGQDVTPSYNGWAAHDRVCEGSPVIDGSAVRVRSTAQAQRLFGAIRRWIAAGQPGTAAKTAAIDVDEREDRA